MGAPVELLLLLPLLGALLLLLAPEVEAVDDAVFEDTAPVVLLEDEPELDGAPVVLLLSPANARRSTHALSLSSSPEAYELRAANCTCRNIDNTLIRRSSSSTTAQPHIVLVSMPVFFSQKPRMFM